jgi:hypothetical protein
MRKLLATFTIIGVLASIAVLAANPASASVYEGSVDFVDCTNADAAGSGPHTLDRDNTGTGQEALRVEITDGNGTIIYELEFENILGTFAGGIGDFFYATPPAANPLTFTLTSLAGNGLPEQVDFVAYGVCDSLPFAAPTADAPGAADAGETITITGEGCIGPATAVLLESEGSETVLASGTTEAVGGEEFAIELAIPADTPTSERVIEVFCGTVEAPDGEAVVLGISILGQAAPTTTVPPTAPAAPRPATPVAATPAFTG